MSDETSPTTDLLRDQRELDLFDYALIRNVIGYLFRSVRRHVWLSAGILFVVIGLGLGVVALLPRMYHADSRMLANQNELIKALGNPRSSVPSEDPTRAARELIFAHQNLVSLVKQTGLVKNWDETRPFVVKAKDSLVQALFGPTSEQDQIDMMVGTLEKRLRVDTDRQTVSISIEWPDPHMAYLLVETAQQNFLETRHVTEMTAISEALSILEMHAGNVQKTMDDALHELERVREQRRKGAAVALAPSSGPESGSVSASASAQEKPSDAVSGGGRSSFSQGTEQELGQLKFLLNSKRRALQDLVDSQTRRVAELTNMLQEQRVQYAPQHPVILDTQQRLAAVSEKSPQMLALKSDIDQLVDEYTRKGGRSPDAIIESPAARPRGRSMVTQAAVSGMELADDPMVEFARNNLRVAAAKYEDLMMRIDGARIEQDTATAAFKYRYNVVRPASVPKKPVSPNTLILSVAVLIAALALAFFSGAIKDALSGRFIEAWQVERSLDLKVLSSVRTR